jgi:DNA polymerase/3'-5' exonuclease PolX
MEPDVSTTADRPEKGQSARDPRTGANPGMPPALNNDSPAIVPPKSLAEMRSIAESFVELVVESTDNIQIVGSIRRMKPNPRDIDIVAISTTVSTTRQGWFGETQTLYQSLLHWRIKYLIEHGIAKARVKTDGKTMVGDLVAMLEFESVPLDVYYATPETWWGLVQMRTGSARFNSMLATRALSMGLKFHGDGKGITKDGVRIDDGSSEESIFKALGITVPIRPEDRD